MSSTTRRQERREAKARRREGRRPSALAQEFWNLPNILTLLRMAVIPVFVWLLYDADPLSSFLAAAVFAIASITDVVDGYLARRMNLVTVVGKLMDPLADKLIALAALVMLVRLGRIPGWVVIVLLSRELVVTSLRAVAASEGLVIAAGQEGKWKTSLQLVGIISLCVHYTHSVNFLWRTLPVDFNVVGQVLVYLSGVFSVWSAGVYFRGFLAPLARRGSGGGAG